MLMTRITIQHIGNIELGVQPAFRRRHQLLVTRRHDDPLTLLAVARQIHLYIMRVIVFAVLTKNVLRLRRILDIVIPKPTPSRRIDTRPKYAAASTSSP